MGYKINIASALGTAAVAAITFPETITAIGNQNPPSTIFSNALRDLKNHGLVGVVGMIAVKHFLGSPITKAKGAKIQVG